MGDDFVRLTRRRSRMVEISVYGSEGGTGRPTVLAARPYPELYSFIQKLS